ncbi:hypothetical protein BH09VER1_BH09VER1_47310 [soil metagenome]
MQDISDQGIMGAGKKKPKKPRALIGDLPHGVNAYHDDDGSVRVRLGKKFTGAVVVKRRFATLGGAKDFIFGDEAQKLRSRSPGIIDLKRDLGAAAFDLPRGVYAEAAAAWTELQKVNSPGGILEATRFYIKHTALTEGIWTIAEATVALGKDLERRNRDERYRKGLAWSFGRFEEDFPKSSIHEIAKSEILDWLDEEDFEQVTRNNYIRDLKILFNFAQREKRLSINPMDEIQREEVPDGEVDILSLRDTARVLLVSQYIPAMKVATPVKFFAGLRTSEMRRLGWPEMKRDVIVVQAKKAKTRARRTAHISENLRYWLPKDKPTEGLVAPQGREWRSAFELLKISSGVVPWPRNCQRHAFGSYHLARHKNENLTASEMGNSPDVIIKHYRAVIDEPRDIEAYWNLTPKNIEEHAQIDSDFAAILNRLKK